MKEVNETVYLEDLRTFRWDLFHHRDSRETVKCLCRYYFKKYNFQHFSEEIVIAGYDLQNLNGDIRQEVLLHIPGQALEEFPSIRDKDVTLWDLNRFFICLLYGNETVFIRGLEVIAEKKPHDLLKLLTCAGFILWQLESWLHPSVRNNFLYTLKKLRTMNNICDPSLIDTVQRYGEYYKFWRGKIYKNIVEVIDAILPEMKFRHKKMIEHFERGEVLDILIDWDLNSTTLMMHGHTALYNSVERNNLQAIYKLLDRGSFIGTATNLFDPKIWNIDSRVLEKHFDKCITRCVDDERFIEIDFKNLILPESVCDQPYMNEMKAIEMIADSSDHKNLLVHPLISTFVLLKWNQLAFIFHIHFLLYIMFTLSTVGYIWYTINGICSTVTTVLRVLSALLLTYVAVRRITYQIFDCQLPDRCNRIYNILECFHTALEVIFVGLILIDYFESSRAILATICIMLMSFQLFYIAGSLFWSFSRYYVMFLDVAMSSIKSSQLCLILLPAFSLSFYLLLWNQSANTKAGGVNVNEHNVNDTMHVSGTSFGRLKKALIKIIAMSAGEFEAATSHYDSNFVSAYLFLGFLFLISIVFMNLMNGLAVSDTQKIQADAEATSMIQRVRLLAHYEGVISHRRHRVRQKIKDCFFVVVILKVAGFLTSINPLGMLRTPQNTKIFIAPNNKMLILHRDYRTVEQDSVLFDQNGFYLYSWVSYLCVKKKFLRANKSIVNRARRILDRKDADQREENEKNHWENQISNMEHELKKIMQMISENNENAKLMFGRLNCDESFSNDFIMNDK